MFKLLETVKNVLQYKKLQYTVLLSFLCFPRLWVALPRTLPTGSIRKQASHKQPWDWTAEELSHYDAC